MHPWDPDRAAWPASPCSAPPRRWTSCRTARRAHAPARSTASGPWPPLLVRSSSSCRRRRRRSW
uniref:Uncharacterized protein n=1 Tax=Triticum urartu TaxID=4572 RepID=A0A8R7UDG6_TRIUA